MSTLLTIPQIGIKYAKKQPILVDSITEDAPALKRFQFMESSHGLWNLAEERTGVTGAGFVQMDAPLPDMSVESQLKKVDLSIMGGKIFVGQDKANQYGGKDKYLADNLPTIYSDSGQKAEKAILYTKFRAAAVQFGCTVKASDAPGTGCYSVLVVRMKQGENCGLFDPKKFKQGTLLETEPLNGGNIYTNEKGTAGYGWISKSYFGWQTMTDDACAAVVNINKDNPLTSDMLDEALELAKFDKSGTTIIIAHTRLRPMFNKFKGDKLQIVSSDKGIDVQVDTYNGLPLVYSRNMLNGTESPL